MPLHLSRIAAKSFKGYSNDPYAITALVLVLLVLFAGIFLLQAFIFMLGMGALHGLIASVPPLSFGQSIGAIFVLWVLSTLLRALV